MAEVAEEVHARASADAEDRGRRTGASRRASHSAEESDQLVALAFGQAADGLRRRDPTVGERASRPDRTNLRQRKEEVVHLRRLCALRRPGNDFLDPHPPRGKLPLQLRSADADLIRLPQGAHALVERPPGGWIARLARHEGILGEPSLSNPRTCV